MNSMTNQVGIDLVSIKDIEKRLSDKFISRILSQEEQAILQKISHKKKKLQFIAGRFAAKEAYVKAYKSFDVPVNFVDVQILHRDQGIPYVQSTYRPNDELDVSISHTDDYAIAIVIIKKTSE